MLVATSVGLGTIPGNLRVMLNIATPLRYKSPWVYERTIAGMVGGRARTDPEWVLSFVAEREDQLSGLSKREARKHLGAQS